MNMIHNLALLCCCLVAARTAAAETLWSDHGPLEVTPDGRHLQHDDGTPFFWIGDTAWGIGTRVDRADVTRYLDNRRAKGFTLIQGVVHWAHEAGGTGFGPEAANPANRYGHRPFNGGRDNPDVNSPRVVSGGGPDNPNDFWDHIDYLVRETRERGLAFGMLPTWGKGSIPSLFNGSSAYAYGRFLGQRYRNEPHIIWVLGGDTAPGVGSGGPASTYDSMARGIRDGGARQLMTFHPGNAGGSKQIAHLYFDNSSWLAIDMYQTVQHLEDNPPRLVKTSYEHTPVRPVVNGESLYEGYTWWIDKLKTPLMVRRSAYQTYLGGGCGYTYGHEPSADDTFDSVWAFGINAKNSSRSWKNLLDAPAAGQMGTLKNILATVDWWSLRPDQSIITSGVSSGATQKMAAYTANRSAIMVYFPNRSSATIRNTLGGTATPVWMDPRNGNTSSAGSSLAAGSSRSFLPPSGWEDAVLRLRTGATAPVNTPPSVSLANPGSGSTVPATVNLSATAADSDGQVVRVEFLVNGAVIGQDSSSPYTTSWQVSNAGTYTVAARAIDDDGASSVSQSFSLVMQAPDPDPDPDPGTGGGTSGDWTSADIGQPGRSGSTTVTGDSLVIAGGGADIWDRSDSFRFVYQALPADGQIVARVVSQGATDDQAKAGVMIRDGVAADAPHAMVVARVGAGIAFQRRSSRGGTSSHTGGSSQRAPVYLKLTRSGNVITAYESSNGSQWQEVGSVSIAMANPLIGLCVTSHDNAALSQVTFDDVAVSGGSDPGEPDTGGGDNGGGSGEPTDWVYSDIGSPAKAGSATISDGVVTIKGGGADIWGGSDSFFSMHRALPADGSLTIRVLSQTETSAHAKVGVMIRNGSAADAAHAMAIVRPGEGVAFQRRLNAGSNSASTSGSATTAPVWLRITRVGDLITGYESSNGSNWTTIASVTIAMSNAQIGLCITSHNDSMLSQAVVDSLVLEGAGEIDNGGGDGGSGPIDAQWAIADIGSPAAAGTLTVAGDGFTIAGSGSDIWGSRDVCSFAHQTVIGDGQMVIRVDSLTNTNQWAKVGIMLRSSLAADAAHAMVVVSPSNGVALQSRSQSGGTTSHQGGSSRSAPVWLRLTRAGSTITADESTNGSQWTRVGVVTIPMGDVIEAGVCITSHNDGVLAEADIAAIGLTFLTSADG